MPAFINPKLAAQCAVGSPRGEAKIARNHLKLITHFQTTQVKPKTGGNDSLVHLKLQEKPPYYFFLKRTPSTRHRSPADDALTRHVLLTYHL